MHRHKTYRLINFKNESIKALCEFLRSIGGFETVTYPHTTSPITKTLTYLKQLGCKSMIVESPYQDNEYRDEFYHYHSRVFRRFSRDCCRLHFFTNHLKKGFIDDLKAPEGTPNKHTPKNLDYLGFIVIRPTESAKIGRTVLKQLKGENNADFILCGSEFSAILGKLSLKVKGVPFIQADRRVMVCAQASLWIALRSMHQKFGLPTVTPYEITKSAMRHRGDEGRTFPSEGLSMGHMVNSLTNLGYSPVRKRLPKMQNIRGKDKKAKRRFLQGELFKFIHTYAESEVPVVVGISREGFYEERGHAVTVIGHTLDPKINHSMEKAKKPYVFGTHNWCTGFIIHDDANGPYRILPRKSYRAQFKSSKHYSKLLSEYNVEDIDFAIVPLPPSVGFPGESIERWALSLMFLDPPNRKLINAAVTTSNVGALELFNSTYLDSENPLVMRTYLMLSNQFRISNRKGPRNNEISDRLKGIYGDMKMPTFIWLAEVSTKKMMFGKKPKILGEMIFDATAYAESPVPYLSIHLPGFIRKFNTSKFKLDRPDFLDDEVQYTIPMRMPLGEDRTLNPSADIMGIWTE